MIFHSLVVKGLDTMKVLILLHFWTFCTGLKVKKYQKTLVESYEIIEEPQEAQSDMQCCTLCSNTIGCQGIKFEDSQCSLLKNTKMVIEQNENCQVDCSLVVDNELLSVSLNNQQINVNGNHKKMRDIKTFSFNSCKSGSLIVNATDYNNGNHCTMGGLVLHCNASDVRNPWHNFVSDEDHWKASHGQTVCARSSMPWNIPLTDIVKGLGGKKIWVEDTKTVTLIGTPSTPSSVWLNNEMILSEDDLAEDPPAGAPVGGPAPML